MVKQESYCVVHIVDWPRSGIGVAVELLLKDRSRNFASHVICLEHDEDSVARLKTLAASVEVLQWRRHPWSAHKRLRALLRSMRADMVHAHSFLPTVLAAISAPRGMPLLRSVHNEYPHFSRSDLRSRLKRAVEKIALRRFRHIVCVADSIRSVLPWRLGLPVSTITNGIETNVPVSQFAAISRASLAIPASATVIVAAARLEEQKGIDLLIEAFETVQRLHSGVLLLILGDGSQKDFLKELSAKCRSGSVVFTGHVTNVTDYLRLCDIYVSPSRHEGFGLALAEAMAIGLPVVATKTGGLPAVMQDGTHGVLASSISAPAIAEAILRLINDPVLRSSVAAAGQTFVTNKFSAEAMRSSYHSLYTAIANV